jgi:hypothetical protein
MEDHKNMAEKIAEAGAFGGAVLAAELAAHVWNDVTSFSKAHPARASVDALFGVPLLVADAELHKK